MQFSRKITSRNNRFRQHKKRPEKGVFLLTSVLFNLIILRDRQTAVYDRCAKKHGLTVNELFVLDILWFAPEGCTQKEISDRLSANKQTINAIITRFDRQGFISYKEVKEDGRNKRIKLSDRPPPTPKISLWRICRLITLPNS